MYSTFGNKKVTAYCVRELIWLGRLKTGGDREATQYLFDKYYDLCDMDDPRATSLTRFRPYMEEVLNNYYNK